jgi:ABC-type long-subunit fatty acid transport system fused permease/ATPase subunit
VFACGGFAAISGSSVATAATFSTVAYPEMRRYDYPKSFATGVIAAGGTLGAMLPPSTVLAVYGLITQQDVGKLFMAGILPGLLAMADVHADHRRHRAGQAGLPADRAEGLAGRTGCRRCATCGRRCCCSSSWSAASMAASSRRPRRAASARPGASCSACCARRLDGKAIRASLLQATRTAAAVFTVLIGALLFGYFLTITQVPQKVTEFLTGLGIGTYGVLALIMLMYLVLGCLMDAMAMIILTVPIIFPVVTQLGFDPIWFGVIIVMTVELGLIHPPVGMNVFVIKSVVHDVSFSVDFQGRIAVHRDRHPAAGHPDRLPDHRSLAAQPAVRLLFGPERIPLMKKVGSFVGDWWRLVVPYFKSEDWPFAIPLLIGAVALTFTGVGLEVLFNEWNRRFYDSLQNKDEATFWREITVFSVLAAFFILNYVARAVVSPYLRLRWRRWLTKTYLAHWLDGRGYYRIELQRTVDNADQRIAEDLRFLGEYTMQLLLGFLGAVATLISFIVILWTLSGPLSLGFIGLDVTIPGYMAWAALIYAFLGTFLANLVGRRLISLNFMKQRFEANFRFGLVRVRENAEGIALYNGEQREADELNLRLPTSSGTAGKCCSPRRSSPSTRRVMASMAIIFPYLVTAPRYFAGAITLGVMMQTASAFGQVQTALSFFVDNYTSLAELRAVMDRLKGLQAATDDKPATTLDVVPQAGRQDVTAEGLTLALPNGRRSCGTRGSSCQGPGDPDLRRQRLGQEHLVPCARRHLAVRQRPREHTRRCARAVPAAEALHPDRHLARRGEVSRRALDRERRRDRGGARGGAARPSGAAAGRGRALEQHPLGRRAATIGGGARAGLQARLAVHGRGDGVARRRVGSGGLSGAQAAAARRHHGLDRPSPDLAAMARPPARTAAPARRGRPAGRAARDLKTGGRTPCITPPSSSIPTRWTGRWAASGTSPSSCSIRRRSGRPRPTSASCATSRARAFHCTSTTSRRSGTSSTASSRWARRSTAPAPSSTWKIPHFENEMRTETGGTVLFVQYPGPTTGARPIYDGRMNLTSAPAPETLDLEH